MRFKDQAICIRLIDWSETSQVVALLTEQHGKLRGLAKGSKRTSPGSVARYSGGIELLTLGQIVGNTRPTSELATLTEWDLQKPYRHLHEHLRAQQLAYYAADLVNALLADHDNHPRCFTAMSQLLDALADESQYAQALLRFQWEVLSDCGYQPELNRDAATGDALKSQSSYTFDAKAGGITMRTDAPKTSDTGPWKVRKETVQLLRALNGDGDDGEQRLHDAGDDALMRANRLLCVYVRTILDRELPTMGLVMG